MNPTYDQIIINDLLRAIKDSIGACQCAPLCGRCAGLKEKTEKAVYSRYERR